MKRIGVLTASLIVVLSAVPAGAAGEVLKSDNIEDLGKVKASTWVHRATFRHDLMFASYYEEPGSGFDIYRIGDEGKRPLKRLSSFPCPSNQEGTISHWKHFVFQALEAPPAVPIPDNPVVPQPTSGICGPETGGIRVVDVSNPLNPHKVGFIRLTCGSHGITTFPKDGRLYIFNTNGCSGQGELTGSTGQGGVLNAAQTIDVLEFDPKHPSRPISHNKPKIPGMAGCHDMTIYAPRDLAVCTGTGRWRLLDISDPGNPEAIGDPIDDLATGPGSAQFTWDGQHVVMNEIPGRGFLSYFGCFGPHRESLYRLKIWNVEDLDNPVKVGDYAIEREPPMWDPTEDEDYRCHPANFTVVPMKSAARYVAVTSWGFGGLSVIDFSDPGNIKELAYWQPQDTNIMWLSTWYNGRVYVSENWVGEGVKADVRVLRVEGLGQQQTRFFKEGLVTQWQDPAGLSR